MPAIIGRDTSISFLLCPIRLDPTLLFPIIAFEAVLVAFGQLSVTSEEGDSLVTMITDN